jgi:hypothetical protein
VSRKEVRSAIALLVDVLVLCTALEASPNFAALAEPRRLAERSRRRVSTKTAALDRFTVLRASRRGRPRLKPWPGTLD